MASICSKLASTSGFSFSSSAESESPTPSPSSPSSNSSTTAAAAEAAASGLPADCVASRSIMSRSSMRGGVWRTASCQRRMALKVSGLSHKPPIIMSRPASIRLAMAISPSRDSNSTLPISRRYMRTGSSVRPTLSSSTLPLASSSSSPSARVAGLTSAPSPSSASSASDTVMPASLSIAMVSSIISEDTCSEGSTALISSTVT